MFSNHAMNLPKDDQPNINIQFLWNSEHPLDHVQLVGLLNEFGALLPIPLSKVVDINNYAEKLLQLAEIGMAFHHDKVVGLIILYCNDTEAWKAHIPMVTVSSAYRGLGVGSVMMARSIAFARQRQMKNLWLTVEKENDLAIRFYKKIRFTVVEEKHSKLVMNYNLEINDTLVHPQQTPLESAKVLADAFDMNIDLHMKRDDLYPLSGGGIKARKISYIIKKAVEDGYDAVVTNGGPQSNHARATAITAANLGLKCHLVVVLEEGQEYAKCGNILLMQMSGATIEYTTKENLASTMDIAVEKLAKKGHQPLYIWGGGHCLQGTVAFVDAAAEARRQCADWIPDYLVLASGTGSTQAGLIIGYADLPTKVIGVSIARERERGTNIIQDCIEEYYIAHPSIKKQTSVDFRDDWIDQGYEKYSGELFGLIEQAAKTGYFFDPTYSGKGWRGLVSLVHAGEIPPGSKVLFWHTGGLLNLQAILPYTKGTFHL